MYFSKQFLKKGSEGRRLEREGGRREEERKEERKKKEGKKMELQLYMGKSFHPHILHEDKTHISKSMPLVEARSTTTTFVGLQPQHLTKSYNHPFLACSFIKSTSALQMESSE